METETEPKRADTHLSNIANVDIQSDEIPKTVDNKVMTQLKTHGLSDQLQAKLPNFFLDLPNLSFFFLVKV